MPRNIKIQKILSLTKNKFTIDDFMTVYTKKKLKSDLSEMLKEFEELNIIDDKSQKKNWCNFLKF